MRAYVVELSFSYYYCELILTVEMETRNPVQGYFGSEFPASCNHCGIMEAWSYKTLKFEKFLRFLEKRHVTVNFWKFCFESFYRDTDRHIVFKFRKIRPTGNRWNHALLTWQKKTKFRLALQLLLLHGSHPKSARASPRQCTQSAPDFIQIGLLSAELQPNAWTPPKRAIKWIQYSTEAEA